MLKRFPSALHAKAFPTKTTQVIGIFLALSLPAWAQNFDMDMTGNNNPIVAGIRAMLEAMGFESSNKAPFPETNPFDAMGDMPWSNMGGIPWSPMMSMPGGVSPWSSMGNMPWSPMGSMPFGGIPGMSSPWDYARPDRWSDRMPPMMRRQLGNYLSPSSPKSPTRQLDGIWISRNGDRLWFREGWLRIYRDDHRDARALVRDGRLYVGIPETKTVLQYDYGIRGNILGLRDENGNVQILKRYR